MSLLPNSRTEPDGSAVIRVLSYNIRSMRDDTDALARVIRACEPDLVLVQEAPRFFRWRKKLARLALASDLVIVTGGATTTGPAILSSLRAGVERTEDILLPPTPGLHRRGFATAVLRFAGTRLGVLSCHLSLQKDERYEQSGMLLDRLAGLGVEHAIAGGDLNERPEGPAFRRPRPPGAASTPGLPPTPTSASTRSSRPAASRCWAVACRPGSRGCPTQT